jgi:predicted HicB family RNase H-like nuclease
MMISHTNSEFEEILSVLNSNNTPEKGITKSFRIDEDVIRQIAQQAKNNNNSLNTEVNTLLRVNSPAATRRKTIFIKQFCQARN